MKLIDKYKAFNLLEIEGYFIGDIFENKELKQACHKGMSIAYNLINDMPIIEAIPIEWIKSYIQSLPIKLTVTTIRMMIEDWRQENESNI